MLHDLSNLKIEKINHNNKLYSYVDYKDHLFSTCLGKVNLALLILENKIGRLLTKDDIIYYKDGNDLNIKEQNLEALSKEEYCRIINLISYRSKEVESDMLDENMSIINVMEKYKDMFPLHNLNNIKKEKDYYNNKIIIKYPEHPCFLKYKRVPIALIILENKLNRFLKKEEKVCFRNGDTEDHSFNNLEVFNKYDYCRYQNLLSYNSLEIINDIKLNISAKDIMNKYRDKYPLHNLKIFENKKRNHKGYYEITYSIHPVNINIYYHRLVYENKINRFLLPEENIHHLDENKLNNDPDNLELVTKSKHMSIHTSKNIDIEEAKKLIEEEKLTYEEIAKHFDICMASFLSKTKKIRKGVRTYKCLEKNKYLCDICNKLYVPGYKEQKYCSVRCASISYVKNNEKIKNYGFPSKEKLEKLILEKSLTKIALDYGVAVTTVSKWCKRYGIKLLEKGHWHNKRKDVSELDKETLEKLVWEKSMTKIALDYDLKRHDIKKLCKKYRIQLPPKGHWGLRENLS